MKKFISVFAFFCALFMTSEQIFAAGGKLNKPKNDEVILIGKISVTPEENMDFYAESRGLSDVLKSKNGTYYLPFASKKDKSFEKDYENFKKTNWKQQFNDGEFFYATYKLNKSSRNMKFNCLSAYWFFGSPNTFIYLPFDFNFDVPEEVKAVYIGSFSFTTTGDNFAIKSVKTRDEYEAAQKVLDSVTEEHYDLYRPYIKENPKEKK